MIPALINPMMSGRGAAAAACDLYWANVVLLMGFEGANGATGAPGMTDESPAAHGTGTATNATISTSQFEFGASSLFRTGVGGLTFANSADWQLGSGPFTIEMWVRGDSSIGASPFLVSLWGGAGNTSWTFWISGQKLDFNVSTDGSNNISQVTGFVTLVVNAWTAVAIDFDGTKYRTYVNGTMDGSSTTLHTFFNSTAVLSIAQINDYGGYIDELRITKGVARYASDSGYTVATARFPRTACSSAPPSFVNGGIIAESTSPSTGTLPGSRVTGNLLVLYFKSRNTANDPSVSAGWTQLDTFGFGGASQRFGVYYCFVTGSETAPVITCAGGGAIVSVVAQYSGTSASTPVVAGSKNGGTGTAITTAAITSSVNAILAVSASWDDTSTSPTQPSGFNNEGTGIFQNVFGSLRLCDNIIANSGSSSPSVSCTGGSSPWGAFLFEMRPT